MGTARNRGTAMEISEQVDQVRKWLTMGLRPYEVRRKCSETYGICGRTAESRMQEARRQQVADVGAIKREELLAQSIEALQQVLYESMDNKQCSNAIGAIRLMSELTGLQASKAS